ncbi:MAG TPA: histidine kinase [Cyclobacteriaceae bacterium]|nr:histidine kinase [Cyclobacteriaceae bacterium]HRW98371.1 histidine kinase [Cyclobacteriaceae bacterium]
MRLALNKQKLYWTLQIGGWSLYATVQIAASVVAAGALGVSTQRIVFLAYEAVFCLLVSHLYRHYINKWRWLSLGMPRLIPKVILSVFALGLLMYFLRIPISLPLKLFSVEVAFDPQNILGLSLYYAIIFFLWSALYFIYNYFERYNKSLKLEAYAREIELNNLKSQLNPHFIFNALNSIRALVDENPAKSKQAINQLSSILRNSLVTEKRELTRFQDELKVVKDYLGLESIRFEERLHTEFIIDPNSKEFLVPPLMIQTLVENGIKHGISRLTEGGLIQIKTSIENDRLKIQIRNSGKYINGVKRTSGGMGLENTKQRLRLIYGDAASFRILNENDSFVLTEINIPHINTI